MNEVRSFLKDFFLTPRFFWALGMVVLFFIAGAFIAPFFSIGQVSALVLVLVTATDILVNYHLKEGLSAERRLPDRFSNGDLNPVSIWVESRYTFPVRVGVVDEIPPEFQIRNFYHSFSLQPREPKVIQYQLRPVRRGEYHFGYINLMLRSKLALVARRYRFQADQMVPTYPSFIQMRKYELLAISNRLSDIGIKKIRRLGHTMEFDQIRSYVQGDDIRTINWKATARARELMVNQYQDERSQQVISIIDMGKSMKAPFNEMTLLDYAINTSLVMCNTAMVKEDKAGLVTLTHKIESYVAPTKRRVQMRRIQEVLYNQETSFEEPNYELLFTFLRNNVNQRSLLLLYTNFETHSNMRRNARYLRQLAKRHLVVVIFFRNEELTTLAEQPATNTEEVYVKTIAEKFLYEKQQIVRELASYGIHSILTTPENLTVNTLNKYLELKARGLI